MPGNWRYFAEKEVKCLEPELVAMLDRARHIAGIPFIITSGFRTAESNFVAGGKDNSAHLRGLAVDIRCDDSRSASLIKRALYEVGFRRVGNYFMVIGDQAVWAGIHVDIDETLDQDVEWVTVRNP